MRSFRYYLWVALLVIGADQVIKLLVKTQMQLHDEFPVIGDLFKIHFIENPGAAFGMTFAHLFDSLGADAAKILLTLVSLIAVSAIIWYLHKIRNFNTYLPLWVAIILGGALGNIIDRVFYGVWFEEINRYEGGLFYGQVVDMFYIDIWQGVLPTWIPFFGGEYYSLWPVFNFADAAISVGIVAILIWQKKLFPQQVSPVPAGADKHPSVQLPEEQTT
ncbi:MAG: signal peptidase II [Bacteroidetes bacterium]|nr:signal peptidase II [Bacteroidota bacterium]